MWPHVHAVLKVILFIIGVVVFFSLLVALRGALREEAEVVYALHLAIVLYTPWVVWRAGRSILESVDSFFQYTAREDLSLLKEKLASFEGQFNRLKRDYMTVFVCALVTWLLLFHSTFIASKHDDINSEAVVAGIVERHLGSIDRVRYCDDCFWEYRLYYSEDWYIVLHYGLDYIPVIVMVVLWVWTYRIHRAWMHRFYDKWDSGRGALPDKD